MSGTFFGTDGIRGKVGVTPVTPEFFYRLGLAWAKIRREAGAAPGTTVLTARDTRQSGCSLEKAFARGVEEGQLTPRSLGVVPTPVLCWQMGNLKAGSAAMLTASHNPASDNGIKFFLPPGRKLTIAEENALESALGTFETNDAQPVVPAKPAVAETWEGDSSAYVERVLDHFSEVSLKGVRIALDTAHGATWKVAPELLRGLGADVFSLGAQPDGQNINDRVGSEHPEGLREMILSRQCDLGIAHDGDGDRVVLMDGDGGLLDGDQLLYILAVSALQRGDLPGKKVVATVQSNVGLDQSLAAWGIAVKRVSVGDRWVSEAMQAEGLRWGGESSGHLICGTYQWTGDGMVAALSALQVWEETGRDWGAAAKGFRKVPQRSGKLPVRHKPKLETLPRLSAACAEAERELAGKGRIMLRYSGTESVLRILVEAPTRELAQNWFKRLEHIAREEIGSAETG
ncbi:MAG: phosphoglucosamine mutase [Opitutales bacterium]|nr:phosphoglucosamine mutase [Opitutales bacterium]MCH8540106.1 phosphoglucosamine mutase [Opitutales bacterium]